MQEKLVLFLGWKDPWARGPWWAPVCGAAKSGPGLSTCPQDYFFYIRIWKIGVYLLLHKCCCLNKISIGLITMAISISILDIQSHLAHRDPMGCSRPGFPVLHHLPELAQTQVHWIGDAIQPSHPLLSPSLLAFNLSQHQDLSNESVLPIRWPKYWSFYFSISPSNEYWGLISFRTDWFDLFAVQGTLKSLLQHHSSKVSIP